MSRITKVLAVILFIVAIIFSMTWVAYSSDNQERVTLDNISTVDNKIILSLENKDNVTNYQIAYKPVKSDKWSYKVTSKKTSKITGKSLTEYKVKVRAFYGNTYGKWSTVKRIKTGIAKPKIIATSYEGPVVLKWWKLHKVKKYQIAYRIGRKSKWQYEYVTKDCYKLDCKPGKIYTFKIRGISKGVKSKWSKPVKAGINYGLQVPGYITMDTILIDLSDLYSNKEGYKIVDRDLDLSEYFESNNAKELIEDYNALKMSDGTILGYVNFIHLQHSKRNGYETKVYGTGCEYLKNTVNEILAEKNMEGCTYSYISGGFFIVSDQIDKLKGYYSEVAN